MEQLLFNAIENSKSIHYLVGFNDPEGFRTCEYGRFMRMVEEGKTPELCEIILDQEMIHPYSDIDSNDQNVSLNEVLERSINVLNFLYADKVSVPLQFAISGVWKYN